MDLYDELQDILRGPVIHLSQMPRIKWLKEQLKALRADLRKGMKYA